MLLYMALCLQGAVATYATGLRDFPAGSHITQVFDLARASRFYDRGVLCSRVDAYIGPFVLKDALTVDELIFHGYKHVAGTGP